ncbi:hypothetical protein MCOR27_005976 [Pyricularia oryzae]|uniref:Uncharacterized protein n=3 Tax=Pyricularia TaxID=48558 RepID=A0ABQ8NR35_PYRGI|nr:uncharacterized protein MGG_00205 [Pyricularia oryzae 70-15]KAH8841264.1 hypothetical protein MCOR01_007935 [Pyricularia oryzae]KAI6300746.1 hypothetical protein MCOR33_003599 [Pyricularia grisea]EHA49325.1 hypothetical protein MGG_00205 [Pyricularia oryzae 70-15]KAH9433402.1 hypothetical protein MCOR02_005451 [Pyricularia oryzae]KAI6257631.1 hypothetical protein MCOR19_005974 [Pyricularia oryzae]
MRQSSASSPWSWASQQSQQAPGRPLARLLPLLLLQLVLFTTAALGFDPVKDAECDSVDSICLTSFRWCARNGRSCHYPEGVDAYIPWSTSSPYAMLYHGNVYDVTWKQAVPGVPVKIEWFFSEKLYTTVNDGWGTPQVMWSMNTTDSSFTFDPLAILMSFPTQYSNISSGEAIAATHDVSNYLRISQPNATSDSQRAPALTDQFLVHTGWTEEFVRNVQAFDANLYGQQQRNWQIGVGAGIGIGLPLIVVLSWFMGHRLGTKAGYELAAKVARRREVREMS